MAPTDWTTITRDFTRNIGAEIMGRNKFGPQRGPWENYDWQGWWGDDTPFHTPVFVLTHYERPSIVLGDTTFHFLTASPQVALATAFDAAQGKDVRLGGGVATVLEFLAAGLVDQMHFAVAPVTLGRGEKLWDHPEDFTKDFFMERVPSPSGVIHYFYWRRDGVDAEVSTGDIAHGVTNG